MKDISSVSCLVLFLHFCLQAGVITAASQSTRVHRSKRLSSMYCSSDTQCQNGGLCKLNSCTCAYGYTGFFCETRLQCKNDSDCFRRGRCELDQKTNTTFCKCNQDCGPGRYEGVFCEKRLPCHATGYCLNRGLCRSDPGVKNLYWCQCPDGFTGSNCQEKTFCHFNSSCQHTGICQYSSNFTNGTCLCDKQSGYTGYYCELGITPAHNYSEHFYWPFNQRNSGARGAAKTVRDRQLGNVISLQRTGGGWLDLGPFSNICMNGDLNACQQGISFTFWLQFNDGVYVISITNANGPIFSVRFNDSGKLLIQLQLRFALWQIKRDCFPVGWVHLTVTWNKTKMMYYENGNLLQYSGPVPLNTSLLQRASRLSVGSNEGIGGFSTMRMSDLAFWTRELSKQEVKTMYLKKFSSPFASRCLSNPCPSNQWCEDDRGKPNNFTCVEPVGSYCSFNRDYCQWRNASNNHHHWKEFTRYGSLRHDHTEHVCAEPLGMESGAIADGQIRAFSEYDYRYAASQARLHLKASGDNIGCWSASRNRYNQWLQIDLKNNHTRVTRVATQGRASDKYAQWVTRYKLQYSENGNIFWYYRELGQTTNKEFPGNTNGYTVVYHDLNPPIRARYIRFIPEAWNGHISMRVELYGCPEVSRKFLGLVSQSKVRSDVVSKTFLSPSFPGQNVTLSMWYYMEGWLNKTLSVVVLNSTGNRTLFNVKENQSRKWNHLKIDFSVKTSFQIILCGEVLESGGIFIDDVSVKTFDLPVILSENTSYSSSLHNSTVISCVAAYAVHITWYRRDNLIQQGRQYVIHQVEQEGFLEVKDANCQVAGNYTCMVTNEYGSDQRQFTLTILEPDPPKTFRVVLVNITTALVTWSAYECNGMENPSALLIRYRQEGQSTWDGQLYNNPANELTITGQFQYGTVYEFVSRLVYDQQVGVFGNTFKTLFPDLSNVTISVDFTGESGTAMTIYCAAVGPAAMTFSWEKDHVTLKPSYWLKIEQYNSTCSVLTIRTTTKADSGNYTCNVSKSWRSLQATMSVLVLEPPKVNVKPLVRTLFEGESATFRCDLSRGNVSRLSISWYKRAENGQDELVDENKDSLSLTVRGHLKSGTQSNVVQYRCIVRNTDGVGSSPLARLVILRRGNKAVCKQEISHGVTWSVTLAGMTDIQRCPNATGRAVRRCFSTGSEAAKWGQADFSGCVSRLIMDIYEEVLAYTEGYVANRTLSAILENLESVTAARSASDAGQSSGHMYERDLKASVGILTTLIKYNAANKLKPLSNKHNIDNLVKTSSNLLRRSNLPAWKTAVKTQQDIAYRLVLALDEYGHHSTLETNDINVVTENIAVVAVKIKANTSMSAKGLKITEGQSSLEIPPTVFSQLNSTVTAVTVFFSTLGHVLTSTKAHGRLSTSLGTDSHWTLNSILASVTIRPAPPDVISTPFNIALEAKKVPEATPVNIKRACAFLNVTTPLARALNNTWSTTGCHVVASRTNSTTTTCACDHMTLFAVLMDSSSDKEPDARHLAALSWISIIGCVLSLICVLISIFVMLCLWRNLRSQRAVVLINLCVAIAVTDALIVVMETVVFHNQTTCTVLAALLHFFVLSIFCWMLSEGVQLYFSLVKIIGANSHINIRYFYCLGWGIPAFIVSVSLAATLSRGYADMGTCWLNSQNLVLWACVAPALIIVSGNLVIFALVICRMLSSHRVREESLTRRFQRGLKASFVLLPLLGFSWSFGVLTITSDKIVFNYLFAISNSLQGLLIFIFHCVLNKQVRDALAERKRRRVRLVTDAITAQSHMKPSTTTGSGGHHSFKILNLHLFHSEICPSPQPSPRSSQAFVETSFVSAELSPVTSRKEPTILLRNTRVTNGREKFDVSSAAEETKPNCSKDQAIPKNPSPILNTSYSNMYHMDERDLTSPESSLFESTQEDRGLENPLENRKSTMSSGL